MRAVHKVLGVWMVLTVALLTLATGVSADVPEGSAYPVPARPDLIATLQSAGERTGFALSADMGEEDAEAAFADYLSKKLVATSSGVPYSPKYKASAELEAVQDIRIVVALVDFSDVTHDNIPKPESTNNTDYVQETYDQAHYERMLFSAGNVWSLRRYFRAASYYDEGPPGDGVDIMGVVNDWEAVSGAAATYGNDDPAGGVDNYAPGGADTLNREQFVRDAAATLSGITFPGTETWADYTTGGVVDYLIIVHAGRGQESGGGTLGDDALWSTSGSLATPYTVPGEGVDVQDYIIASEDSPVGVLVHEMGHLMGLPYTWNNNTADSSGEVPSVPAWSGQEGLHEAGTAYWDPMSHGMWLGRPLGTRPATFNAWQREKLGWLTNPGPVEVSLSDMPASVYLAQLEANTDRPKALKVNLPPRTYVTPYSGATMRRAPDTSAWSSSSYLRHDFEITAATSATLRWWQWYDLRPGEEGSIEIASNAGSPSWTQKATVTGNSGGWVQYSLDLGPGTYPSRYVGVRLVMPAIDGLRGMGWFVDGFELVQDGSVTWSDDFEGGDLGPDQGTASLGSFWSSSDGFARQGVLKSNHYYLAEWRNDGFDVTSNPGFDFDPGLQEAYNMKDAAAGEANYYKYNPGLLVWYVNPVYQEGDNDVGWHPGEGFLLPIDAHPDALVDIPGTPWRSRVQMQDATFRYAQEGDSSVNETYTNIVQNSGGGSQTIGPLAPNPVFYDAYAGDPSEPYPYWSSAAPDNSVKTIQYGVRLEVEGENPDKSGATIAFALDAADMSESTKQVDKATAKPGATLNYTIVLTNTGLADALTVAVTDTAPSYTTYVPGSLNVQGAPAEIGRTDGPDGIFWMGTVPLASPVTITFQVTLDSVIPNGYIIENRGYIYEGTVLEKIVIAQTTVESAPCLTTSTKVADPTAALAGDLITYTISLDNSTGSADAETAMITDVIPSCTTYVDGSLTYTRGDGVYDSLADAILWHGPVLVSEPTTITFQVKINPGQVGCSLIQNEVEITDGMPNCSPFFKHADTSVMDGPNLVESEKTVDFAVRKPGETLQYTVYLYNGGNENATVSFSDQLPAQVTYVPGSLTSTGGTASWVGSRLNWSGSVPIDTSQTIQFSVVISSPLTDGTMITNSIPITAVGTSRTQYLTRSVQTEVLSRPRLSNSTKSVQTTSVGYGGILTYTINLLNDGTEDTTVIMTDSVPLGTEYMVGSLGIVPGSAPAPTYNSLQNEIRWNGSMAAGDEVTITFAVSITLTGSGTIENCATVNDGYSDPFDICAPASYVAHLEVVSPTTTVYCGDSVQVPVRLNNVVDLQGFQVSTDYDTSILQVESIQQGTWLPSAGWTVKTYDNTAGRATVAAPLLAQHPGISGTGILYYLNFRAISDGTTPITITWSTLANSDFQAIPHNRTDGSVTVEGRTVSGVALLQGRPTALSDHGDSLNASTEIMYNGTVLATTDALGNYSFCPPVSSGESATIMVRRQGYLYGSQTIIVPASGSLVLGDLTLLGGDPIGSQVTVSTVGNPGCTTPVTVTVAGPPDGKVNVLDLTFVGARFDKRFGDSDWGPDPCDPTAVAWKADINEDNIVDIFDLVLVGNNFGGIAPSSW